jgi:SAM-dependent methyltransferase
MREPPVPKIAVRLPNGRPVCDARAVYTQPAIEPSALPLTGERTLPGIPHENYWFRRHEVAYRSTLGYCRDADVLDAGCGEGYGSELLRREAGARVVALDHDAPALAHVAARYPGVHPVRADLGALPFSDGTFDAVLGVHVIEQLGAQARFVEDCARVLRPLGTLALCTANRLTFSPGTGADDKPWHPYHVRELTSAELAKVLDSRFYVTRVLGVHHGSRLADWEAAHGSVVQAQLAGPPQGWPAELHEFIASLTAEDFVVTPVDVDEALDVLVVAARR